MTPPWRRILVEEDYGVVERYDDGRVLRGLNIGACDEDVQEVRAGYRCIGCWEPFESAWPKSCIVCGFPVADRQAEEFGRVYKGWQPGMRTGADWDAAADRIEEQKERRAWHERAKRSGVILAKKFF